MSLRPVDRAELSGDAPVVGPRLLGTLLVSRVGGVLVSGRVVEVEAYRQDDPASHTYGGRTARNRVMFGPAGHLYVYLSYGIHRCANVVTGAEGEGQALLLRAAVPVEGVETVRTRRGGRRDAELMDGPGKLCQAFGIELDHDGVDVCSPSSEIRLMDDGAAPPAPDRVLVGPRVGITKAIDTPWRFRIAR